MKSLLLAGLLLFLPLISICQQVAIDSLRRIIERSEGKIIRNPNQLGLAWLELGTLYLEQSDFARAREALLRSLELLRPTNDRSNLARCFNNLGALDLFEGNYDGALAYFQASANELEALGDRANLAMCLNNMGVIYLDRGDHVRALDHFQQSLALHEAAGNLAGAADCLSNIGSIFFDRGDLGQAQSYTKRSLALFEQLQNPEGIAMCLTNLGSIAQKAGNWKQAIHEFERALKLYERHGLRSAYGECLKSIGTAYLQAGQLTQSLIFSRQSSQVGRELGDRRLLAGGLALESAALLRLGQADSARLKAQESLQLAQAIGYLELKRGAAQALYQADSALGRWAAAFEALRLFKLYSDSLRTDSQALKLGRLEARYEAEKQLARLESERLQRDLRISSYRQDSLRTAQQQSLLEATSLRLAQQIEEQYHRHERDSLENAAHLQNLERERLKRQAQLARQNLWLALIGLGLALVLVVAYFLFRSRQRQQKANDALRALNQEIQQQKAEIEAINAELQAMLLEVSQQKNHIETQHLQIEDSIRYASRIQRSFLPRPRDLLDALPPHFIYYQPRDIVSGDFYWMSRQEGRTLFAVVDCTGHGVPGAFMSLLGSNLLHQIVDESGITRPSAILKALDRRIGQTLHQYATVDELESLSRDGMDVALVVIYDDSYQTGQRIIEFAGAGRPLWHLQNGQIFEYRSARYSCGGTTSANKDFPTHRFQIQNSDRLYLFSDGITDQFGGPQGRKLGPAGLQKFILSTRDYPIHEQGQAFAAFFSDWMKNKRQLDDVLLVGLAA